MMAIKVTDGTGGITPTCEICLIVRAATLGRRIECGVLVATAVSLHA